MPQLGKLARRPDIVALSFHVDYWDYIGWKDRFATQGDDRRASASTPARCKQRYVYTPEMVVDGRAHEPGVTQASIDGCWPTRSASRRTRHAALTRMADGTLTIGLAAVKLDGDAGRRHALRL